MDFDTYQSEANRTAKWLGSTSQDVMHASLGLCTELGELTIPTLGDYPISEDGCKEEVGDILWYIALAATTLDSRLSSIAGNAFMFSKESATPEKALLHLARAVGEFATDAKRMVIYDKAFDCEQRDNMLFGLAEMLLYLDQFLAHRRFGFECAMEANIEKLRERFPDRYTNEAAEARADKGGLDARHS